MIKAFFVDYTGTIIEEGGPDIEQVIMRGYRNSDIESPQAMVAFWWKLVREFEQNSFGDSYITQDEIVDRVLQVCAEQIHLKDNLAELHELCRRFWMYAPAFPDTKVFFDRSPLPIYIISNNAVKYIEVSMREKGLHPAGIVCGDMAMAYKPHRELFEKALEISGCRADEVVHIGDSVSSDVEGAVSAGIRPILLDRKGDKRLEGVEVIHSLESLL